MDYKHAFNFSVSIPHYQACYEWRKVVLRSELWGALPAELIDMIAKHCVEQVLLPAPTGLLNFSRLYNLEFLHGLPGI